MVSALELAARSAVAASVARAAHLGAVATYVARARAALGPEPEDRFGLEAMVHAEAHHGVVTELAARLVITEAAADRLVSLALTLTTRLPVTFDAFCRGVVDEARAKVVVEETGLLSDAHAAVVDEALAPVLGLENTARLRQRVKDEVADVDREAVKRRAKRATADRHVRLKALADGMAELTICAPATDVVPAYNTLEALAKDKDRPGGRVDPHAGLLHDGAPPVGADGAPIDQRGLDAHRADTALALLRQGLGQSAPSGCGPQIFVTFPAAVGLDDQPAQLERTGPLPPVLARELLANHRFRRVLTDPLTGHLVAVDGHSYPPGTLPDLNRRAPDDADPPHLGDDDGDSDGDGDGGGDGDGDGDGDGGGDGGGDSPSGRPGGSGSGEVARAPQDDAPDELEPEPEREPQPLPAAHRPCPVAATGGGPYEIAAAIQRFVRARSSRCTAPGCRRPSRQCDTDHRLPRPQGPTCPCNLAPLCRRHHLAKHHFGWQVRKASPDPADPSQHWTSPLGHDYLVPAEPVLPRTLSPRIAALRGVPSETWPQEATDPTHPYRHSRWLTTANTRHATLALDGHTRAHAPPPPPHSEWTGQYDHDPPF